MNSHSLKKIPTEEQAASYWNQVEHRWENKRTLPFTTKVAAQSGLTYRPPFRVVRS